MPKTKQASPSTPNTLLKSKKNILPWLLLATLLLFVTGFMIYFQSRIYPLVSVGNIGVGGLTKFEAKLQIETMIQNRATSLNLIDQSTNQKFTINLTNLPIQEAIEKAIDQAFGYGRTKAYFKPTQIPINFDLETLNQQIDQIENSVFQAPQNSQITMVNGNILVSNSSPGLSVDRLKLDRLILNYLNTGQISQLVLPTKVIQPELDYNQAIKIKNSLDELKLQPIQLLFGNQVWTLTLDDAISFLDFQKTKSELASIKIGQTTYQIIGYKSDFEEISDSEIVFNQEQMLAFIQPIEKQINQPVLEPRFSFDGTKVTEFQPSQEGRKLNVQKTKQLISDALLNAKNTIVLPVEIIKPQNQLINNLGINQLLGTGQSNFAGSSPNRIFNISHSSNKINGVLIKPGEVFSWNNVVGDISAATGYKQAYVIKNGRTVLDDGGGVCQTSTTLFRAVLNAGLPIIKRTAHAYRVSYYEQGYPPGLDATIFYPSVDFQFKNDTPAHILIQAQVSDNSMTINLYGTSDGRTTQLSKPIISSVTPPPPDLKQEDPTLPAGTIKQVDFAASGANVSFGRVVTRNGETIINETFRSNFRPWQAVYLVGTGG